MLPLPIDEHLAAIVAAVGEGNLVLVAEPGTGKTTRVPPALLPATSGEVLVLEPRRLAARLAARRVAEEMGEQVGETVGYQVRFEDVGGPRTRLRFATEGVLGRRIDGDPLLAGVDVVVLDEVHERHLEGDVALARLRHLQRTRRPDLRLVAMSATLEAGPIGEFLGARVLSIAGRAHDVAIEHVDHPSVQPATDRREIAAQVAGAVRRLIAEGPRGSILVFLPGAGEIRAAMERCAEVAGRAGLSIAPLHGDLPVDEQDRAVRAGEPRLILSTNVAESSITVPGVVAVVDCGLARRPRHSPWSGLPSLETVRVSRASAKQRAGRAGRTGPGRCIRLYGRHDHDSRPAQDTPEILRADLAEVVLALRAAGTLGDLSWLDAPPAAALEAADRLLTRLGAVVDGSVTEIGRQLLALPLHPRLGRIVVEAERRGVGRRGALAAAAIAEREVRAAARAGFGGRGALDEEGPSDVLARVEAFEAAEADGLNGDSARRHGLDPTAMRAVARARDQVGRGRRDAAALEHAASDERLLLATLAGFPDRVARRRSPRSDDLVLAEGGAVKLGPTSIVRAAEWVVVVDADQGGSEPTARLVSAIDPAWLVDLFPERVSDGREARFEAAGERVAVVSSLRFGGLVIDESRRHGEVGPEVEAALADAAIVRGAGAFCDGEALARWRSRIAFAATLAPGFAPPTDEDVREALRRLCAGRSSFDELRRADLLGEVRGLLDGRQRAALDRLAPEHVSLPGGRRLRVEYEAGKPPWVASRLQDFFGMARGPAVADGKVPVVLHLLAPSRRPLQITTDLAGFWDRHYPAIRRELMRRYPKHAWPEDPRTASPPDPRRR